MNNRTTKFEGKNGLMLIGPEGITIKRTPQQALEARSSRTIEIRYQDISEVKHVRASLRPGYLQLSLKAGVEGVTPLNRVTRIGYDRENTHRFRRARDIIKSYMSQLDEGGRPYGDSDEQSPNQEDDGFEGTDQPGSTIPKGGLPFRR